MKTAVQPCLDRILVQVLQQEGDWFEIAIGRPKTAKENPQFGKVVAVGPGAVGHDGVFREVALRKGDIVLFGKYAGTELKVDDERMVLLREDEVLARLVTEPS
jgi:chaperonin GroES